MKTISMILITTLFASVSLFAETKQECTKKAMDVNQEERKECDKKTDNAEKSECKKASTDKLTAAKKSCNGVSDRGRGTTTSGGG